LEFPFLGFIVLVVFCRDALVAAAVTAMGTWDADGLFFAAAVCCCHGRRGELLRGR